MTNGIYKAKEHMLNAFVQYGVDNAMMGNSDVCRALNVGVMSLNEFMDEMIMELIRYAYDKKAEKDSIRGHLIRNGMGDDDSKKAAYGRIREYAQKYRDREAADRLKTLGVKVEGLEAEQMDSIEDKLSGYKFNKMQFFELTQMQDIRIMKSFVEHRLEDTNKVNITKFKELYKEYDDFVNILRLKAEMSDEDVVFNSLAYWVIQWKYQLELFYAIAVYDEEQKGYCKDKKQLVLLCGDVSIIRPRGRISTHSRFIKQRNKMIPKLLCVDEKVKKDVEFDSYTMEEYIYLKSHILMYYCVDKDKNLSLKDWFAEETSISDWADFLREYDIFSIHQEKEWTNKRIRTVRELIKNLTIR